MEQFKAAVIGLGNIGMMYDFEPQRPHPSTHVFAFEESPAFQLICGIDNDINKKYILHSAFSDAGYFSDIEEAYNDGCLHEIDVVSVCTPPSSHLHILRYLLERGIGKIIFCEKPLVSNTREVGILNQLIERYPDVTIVPNISRRWNSGLRKVSRVISGGSYGVLEKINIRYTRGIFNTGVHLFDLLKMWSGRLIRRVMVLGKTETSADLEHSFSFYFEMDDEVSGYAEAIDDRKYYLFDIDLYMSDGKIEMRNSGNDIRYFKRGNHHLFDGFQELVIQKDESDLLSDVCIMNAVNNLERVLQNKERAYCTVADAVYPLYVAEALERSYRNKCMEEIIL